MQFSREQLIAELAPAGLRDFDREDVEQIIDVLLEAFTPLKIWTWLCFYDPDLDTTPILAVADGRMRAVLSRARNMVASASIL